ncbi:glycosyltransferase [Pontimicrobium sp. SW4]|uniref:Glycosyltransferase n=1 Tax=Pontimicrobium sp. SW4 TaxID=3153519 RepID=A0AAU7BVB1_9FLAO
MKFLIITHVEHIKIGQEYYAYAPYVQEMNLWFKYVDQVNVVAPLKKDSIKQLDIAYQHTNLSFHEIPTIAFISLSKAIVSLFRIPLIVFKIFKACKQADHIHLRCPGNIGLLGCLVQLFFSKKLKTAKYAGNWDPKAKQPLSYRFQKWILKNEFLTRNIKVLVYGNWKDKSKNIVPFFTASYWKSEELEVGVKSLKTQVNLLFVGTLSKGKQPLVSVKVTHELIKKRYLVSLDIYGEGSEQESLESYIKENKLESNVILHGNEDKEVIKQAYQKAHFLVFISKSEGWPKVVAEAMFWKCLPISTSVSCIPEMLGYGIRGSLVIPDTITIVTEIQNYIENEKNYIDKIEKAQNWSRSYTLDTFETEIKQLLHS